MKHGLNLGLRGKVRLGAVVADQRRRTVSRVVVRRGSGELAKAMLKSVNRLGS